MRVSVYCFNDENHNGAISVKVVSM